MQRFFLQGCSKQSLCCLYTAIICNCWKKKCEKKFRKAWHRIDCSCTKSILLRLSSEHCALSTLLWFWVMAMWLAIKAGSENSWLPVQCSPYSFLTGLKLHSHKACTVLTEQFTFITAGNAEYLFRKKCAETKLVHTWRLGCNSALEDLALIMKMFQ